MGGKGKVDGKGKVNSKGKMDSKSKVDGKGKGIAATWGKVIVGCTYDVIESRNGSVLFTVPVIAWSH
jgi:hypothetical protein